ncbi:MAG: hypothetical protein KIT84_11425 [Labilithrix sp.]|nr:hypothetical protein [Labilithrix sp.]MCW5811620.1 hypothetical protein [Labilithrix sp.]
MNCDVIFDLKGDRDDGFPCFRVGNHTVYYVVVDIFEHVTSASKRPKPKVVSVAVADVLATEEASSADQLVVATDE